MQPGTLQEASFECQEQLWKQMMQRIMILAMFIRFWLTKTATLQPFDVYKVAGPITDLKNIICRMPIEVKKGFHD
jgi:hypothetical protein